MQPVERIRTIIDLELAKLERIATSADALTPDQIKALDSLASIVKTLDLNRDAAADGEALTTAALLAFVKTSDGSA